MIDFHVHVLPGIDDGSRDIGMTMGMLEMEASQGVSHVYATPHFYAHRRSVQQFLERRERALDSVLEILSKRPELPGITAGAEVYYFRGMGKAEQLPELCIQGTDILLLEMPFDQWHEDAYRDLTEIIRRRDLHIVLAHVERYEALQKNREVWDMVMDLPLTIQMNAGSFITSLTSGLHARHTARFCLNMLQEHDNCIIGTDAHNLSDRAPNLAEAMKLIEKKLGQSRLAQLDRYTEELLGN
ncbi:MAG: hypothetical protein IJI11_07580 [Mogibacterium sp.]|nr:hypothetical protein [Mogibacterium sp.]